MPPPSQGSLSQGFTTVEVMSERQFDQPSEEGAEAGDLAGDASASAPVGGLVGGPGHVAPNDSCRSRPEAAELERMVDEFTAAARTRAAAVALETAALIDAVAALKPFESQYGMTWRRWVAWQCGLTTAEARRVCLLAEKLPTLPLLDDAVRRGELSDGVTEVLARVATPANEARVLEAAAAATAEQLQQVARDFRSVRAGSNPPPGSALDDPATMASEASWGWGDDGRHRGSWNLRADDGAVLEAALELALAQFRRTEADIDDTAETATPRPTPPASSSSSSSSAGAEPHRDAGRDGSDDTARTQERGSDPPASDATADDAGARHCAAGDGCAGSAGTDRNVDGAGMAAEREASAADAGSSTGAGPGPASARRSEGSARSTGSPDVIEGELRPEETAGIRRSDALVAFANVILAANAHDGLLPESAQVILHHNLTPRGRVDAARLHPPGRWVGRELERDGLLGAPRRDEPPPNDPGCSLTGAVVPGCGALPDWLAQKLACDSLVITVDMIGGFPVSEPTAQRSFNRAQRRALRARDRHCRYPGCGRTRHLHAHHTRTWSATRRTSVADAVLLCGQHHSLVHLKGQTITLGVDHTVTVTRDDGTTLRGTPLPPPDPTELRAHSRPPHPPPDRRRTGTKEPLTRYARDILATAWHLAEHDGVDDEDDEDHDHPPGSVLDDRRRPTVVA